MLTDEDVVAADCCVVIEWLWFDVFERLVHKPQTLRILQAIYDWWG